MDLQKKLTLNNIKKYVLDIFFPNRCPFCGKVIKWNENCCEKCFAEIPYITTEHCKKCGKENCICSEVQISYDGCTSVTYYSGIIKDGIVRFKTDKALNLVDVFESDMYNSLNKITDISKIDFVTFVPMNKSAKRSRGYNQAEVIAGKLSKIMCKPVISDILIKYRNDIIQHELSRNERKMIVKGLFGFNCKFLKAVKGKNVLLCDDVITTGSTLNECASVLKQNGAESVYCITIASTQLVKNKL